LSTDNAWMFFMSLETLALRMERHSYNALKIAEFLKSSEHVEWVRYPGLESDPAHALAKK